MSNEAQIAADAELARRLQQEELGAIRGASPFTGDPHAALERYFSAHEGSRLPDRTANQDSIERFMEQSMAHMSQMANVANNFGSHRNPSNGRAPGGSDNMDFDNFLAQFAANDAPRGTNFFFHSFFRDSPQRTQQPGAAPNSQPSPPPRSNPRAQPRGDPRAQHRGDPRANAGAQPHQGPRHFHFHGTFAHVPERPETGNGRRDHVHGLNEFMAEVMGGGAGGADMGGLPEILRNMMQSLPGFVGPSPTTYEEWLDLIERRGSVSRGATEEEIERLPESAYQEPRTKSRASSSAGSSSRGRTEEKDKCAICLGEYERGEMVKRLPCSHMYHSECVGTWLKVNKTCPVCKQSIRPESGGQRQGRERRGGNRE